ncbi:hypothetical protein PV325_008396 [Microctonus aethiopoides]|nr:hypothetical protein PV325_008396 [Microctonus aethiopoides]
MKNTKCSAIIVGNCGETDEGDRGVGEARVDDMNIKRKAQLDHRLDTFNVRQGGLDESEVDESVGEGQQSGEFN